MASNSLEPLLRTLTESLETAKDSLREEAQLKPPHNGISLLDTKNELFLSYLQNLVFLVLLKIRQGRSAVDGSSEDGSINQDVQDKVVKTLVELRVYLERGVKPLESRLRYQIDKVVRAAEDDSRKAKVKGTKAKGSSATTTKVDQDSAESSGSDGSEEIDRLAYRPNPSAFKRLGDAASKDSKVADGPSGVYRPPRISATTMPDDRPSRADRSARPQKSATLEEFVASELSTAPVAEPSIGTTIRQGGRRSATDRERRDAQERQAYEESHFVRLPKESKAEQRKKGGRTRNDGWGGEEWHDLGRGADRVVGALGRSRSGGSGDRVRQALERSRKRDRELGHSGSGRGARMGEAFERSKRRKMR
jgi:U3 small nucleolar ribonucleoprotein protein LCP5